jgi:hypothetical protein
VSSPLRPFQKRILLLQASRPGPADVNKVGQAYVKAAPERMVWGSNWPHPNETNKPDDALLFDQLAHWVPEEAVRKKILGLRFDDGKRQLKGNRHVRTASGPYRSLLAGSDSNLYIRPDRR